VEPVVAAGFEECKEWFYFAGFDVEVLEVEDGRAQTGAQDAGDEAGVHAFGVDLDDVEVGDVLAAAEVGNGDGRQFDGAGGAVADGIDADGFVEEGVEGGMGFCGAAALGHVEGGGAGGGVGEGFAVEGDVGMGGIGFLENLEVFGQRLQEVGATGAGGVEVVEGVVAQAVAGANLKDVGGRRAGAGSVKVVQRQRQRGHVGRGQAQVVKEFLVVPTGEDGVAESGEDVFEEGLHVWVFFGGWAAVRSNR